MRLLFPSRATYLCLFYLFVVVYRDRNKQAHQQGEVEVEVECNILDT